MNATQTDPTAPQHRLGEVARLFLKLGLIGFGGPAVHIAMMEEEVVRRRQWMDHQHFLDLVGATNLIPGPNSTEMTMHTGYHRAGWRGLWLGGAAFILPAVVIVLALAWAYVRYGDTPAGTGILAGIGPVVLAIIIQAIWGLRSAALRSPLTIAVALVAFVAVMLGANEIMALFAAGGVTLAWHIARVARGWMSSLAPIPLVLHVAASQDTSPSAAGLFWVFLKIGAVLYGSGYVLVSLLEAELVDSRGWLTREQLVDAIAVGQFTPGPLFSSATFVGYVVEGWDGAALATAGIFLPSFVFVMATAPFVPRLRRLAWASAFLDGVNAAAMALMAAATISLGREALDTVFGAVLFVVAVGALIRLNPNSAWLVTAGAVAGLAREALR
jgi:chromate transporter